MVKKSGEPKVLRPYQVRLVSDVCRSVGDVLVEQPTGSGKTMQIVTLVAMHLGRRFTHAVIAAPQEHIERGFIHRDYHSIGFPKSKGAASPAINAPEQLIWGARQSGLGSVKRLAAYLRQAEPDHALACTHAALNRLTSDKLPNDLTGRALFIDEAHHASADGLSQLVAQWRERGGQLFFFTATPYRGDGRPVAIEGMRLFRRSLAEHMAEGFAPQHLESEIVALGQAGDAVTAGQFTGEAAPPATYFDALVEAVGQRWEADERPKVIVRVPPMRGGSSGLVGRLIQTFVAAGARVLNATGTGASDKHRFLAALKAEQHGLHSKSHFDVMIGIQRVLEGTDWPVCSAVYCVGMPGSLNTVVQLLGRAMRPKGAGYPAAHANCARLVFFVPCGGGTALSELSLDHSRHALLTCCFLADHAVGQEWIVLREVRRGIADVLGPRDDHPDAADAENAADESLDPEIRAEVELALATAREELIGVGASPTVDALTQAVAAARPDLPETAIRQMTVEILAAQPGSAGTKVRKAIRDAVAKQLRIDPVVKEAMQAAFAEVLDEFRAATLKTSPILDGIRRQVHGITGGQMREFAQRLRDAAPRPLTLEQILAWADAHHKRAAEWPGQESGSVQDAPDEKWVAINSALRIGLRGLPGGSSLAQMLTEERGVRNIKRPPPLTTDQILTWADAYHSRVGRWPNAESGPIAEASGETWSGVNAALQTGLRGFPGGSSLARYLSEHRGRRNRKDKPLTVEQILAWCDAHRERTGDWPSNYSGPVFEAAGETWSAVNAALDKGGRSLPSGSSLAKLLAQRRGARNKGELPSLTVDQILAWADVHHERTSKWPTSESDPIADAPGETWKGVSMALVKGLRRLASGSSLAKLLSEHRGVRNIHDLPLLTVDQILVWADAQHESTGEWPSINSGPVEEGAGETWSSIQSALARGVRGFSGVSSLAQLLEEHRGKRNQKNAMPLTVELILDWADTHHQLTGEWPKVKSGTVHGEPSLTWRVIEAALQQGNRGLPGSCSLAKLLAQNRSVRNVATPPPLTIEQILAWADAHHESTGRWPKVKSGPVHEVPEESWSVIDNVLTKGLRGLLAGSSLAQLLFERRGVRNKNAPPPLMVEQILIWADGHHQRTGDWPSKDSGSVDEAPDETWSAINGALQTGLRGLATDSSLAKLLAEHRGTRNSRDLPKLSIEQIVRWVDAYRQHTGQWPKRESGSIDDVPDENWRKVDNALGIGLRGLPGGSSLATLVKEHRRNSPS